MHDALRRYEPDTEIVDVEDLPADPIPRARVATKDLTVHVHLDDGFWHRLDESGFETACGLSVSMRLRQAVRPGRVLEHPLGPCECWTTRERAKADEAYRQKFGRDFTY